MAVELDLRASVPFTKIKLEKNEHGSLTVSFFDGTKWMASTESKVPDFNAGDTLTIDGINGFVGVEYVSA